MNILPKKRWHVRTKDNIARVRRDEAQAKEEERQVLQRQQLAEKEARINTLRQKADISSADIDSTDMPEKSNKYEHVNLFSDLEAGIVKTNRTNEEHRKEKLEEQQKYEKQIGLLTFLGQDTNEALKQKSWYEIPRKELPKCSTSKEKDDRIKYINDPINIIKKIASKEVSCSKQKEKRSLNDNTKERNHSKEKSNAKHNSKLKKHDKVLEKIDKIKMLREQRLKREALEKAKQDALLGKLQGLPPPEKPVVVEPEKYVKQKYHSQFNPHIAKQNY